MHNKNGFSLLELMIVIAIIGILIAIAIPSYQQYMRRAHYMEIVEAAIPYRMGVEECYQLTGTLTECTANKNGIPDNISNHNPNDLISSIKVKDNGIITITPKNNYGIKHEDSYILTPKINEQRLLWHASGQGVKKGYALS